MEPTTTDELLDEEAALARRAGVGDLEAARRLVGLLERRGRERSGVTYLDHNATTPLAAEVLEAMEPWLRDGFGNPSCGHRVGLQARSAVDAARKEVADFFGCARDEVVFTSGGTESNNLAIKGAALALRDRGRHLVVGAAEHGSVRDAARALGDLGFEVSEVPTDDTGRVLPAALHAALRPDTVLVSVMHAQNEVGTVSPVDELAEVLRGRRILFHVDAAQSAGKIPSAFPFLGCDLLTVAAHKLYGPKGAGALLVRRGVTLWPLLHGAGHEGGRRSGTLNVAGIVGLAAALRLARGRMAASGERIVALRDALHIRLAEALPGLVLNGHPLDRLPNTLNLSFLGLSGAALADRLPDVMLATGAACHDREAHVSPTFRALGLGPERAHSSLRLSLGCGNTWEQVQEVADRLIEAARALRGQAAGPFAPSERPPCPRCEAPLRLDLARLAPAVVCAHHPECRYEAHLAPPPGASGDA